MAKKIDNVAIINSIAKSQMRSDLPSFKAGDTITIDVKIVEGAKTRVQKITGVVMRIRGSGLSKTFIVRKQSVGQFVELNFYYHSPSIIKINVDKRGKVRRAYITYMRERSGKSARIKTKK